MQQRRKNLRWPAVPADADFDTELAFWQSREILRGRGYPPVPMPGTPELQRWNQWCLEHMAGIERVQRVTWIVFWSLVIAGAAWFINTEIL